MAVNQSDLAAAHNTQSISAPSHSSSTGDPATQREATLLQDISKVIEGLERCEGLRDVIQQIESSAVVTIRARYGPSAVGRRKTADPSWGKYKNLVSKRERLQRILTEDFGGDKDKLFVNVPQGDLRVASSVVVYIRITCTQVPNPNLTS
jgi:hypothetical protein